jgi:V8-like Glu-specific endopeptidase
MRLARASCSLLFLFLSFPLASGAENGEEGSKLLEILRTAPPAPVPQGQSYTPEESGSPEQLRILGYDLDEGQEILEPPGARLEPLTVPLSDSEQIGWLPGVRGGQPTPLPLADVPAGATPPSPLLNTTSFPFSSVYKLLMRFQSGGIDYYYVCSAASTAPFHLITAGHCIYNHDPNKDGSTGDATFASEVWAWAAQTDRVTPFGIADHPYGEARGTFLRTYTGWTGSGNLDHDWAAITLDRRVGNHTGWMGRETNTPTTALNFSGYPTETPYVPAGTLFQYPGFDANNVLGYTSGRIQMSAYTYGGHSGGPAWRYDGTTRRIQGCNSTSNRAGSAEETLLTNTKFTDLDSWISTDESSRPPTARPDLVEYLFDASSKDLLTNSVAAGGLIGVEYNALNAGYAGSGDLTIDFYLSTNTTISVFDTFLGRLTLPSLDAFMYYNSSTTLGVPVNQAPGTYYVGWILGSSVPEYSTELCSGTPCNNVVVIDNETLAVQGAPCYTLTRAHTGSGADPAASPASSAGCSTGQYKAGQSIQLTASSDSGWSVAGWSGTSNDSSTSTTNSLTMPAAAHTVAVSYAKNPPSGGIDFYTIAPCRVYDSRPDTPLASQMIRFIQVTGTCGIPSSAVAVSLNVTVTQSTGAGYVVLWPADLNAPVASTVTFSAGQTRSNNALLRLATDGLGDIAARALVGGAGTVHVIIDVGGYFQ